MLMRTMAFHMPALTRQEAAMLPALTPEWPHNLLMPQTGLDFRPVIPADSGEPGDNAVRRGTMAGRALLTYVKSAPARRQRRQDHRANSCVT